MPRIFAASLGLVIFCPTLASADGDHLPPPETMLVAQCSKSKITIKNPDSVWNQTKFRCDDGQVRVGDKNITH
jgi:hypothetical protein